MRALALLLVGCSSTPDVACKATLSRDVTGTQNCPAATLCHPTGGDMYEMLSIVGTNLDLHFQVVPTFTLRSYAAADFRSFDFTLSGNGKPYGANQSLAGSTASLVVSGLRAPKVEPCDGTGHGNITATLVEFDPMTDTPSGSGRVDLTVAF